MYNRLVIWKICLLLILSGISNISFAQANEENNDTLLLDFSQSMQMMMDENYAVKAAELEVQEMEYKRKEARSHYYPHFGLMANYTIMKDPLKIDLSEVGDALKGIYTSESMNTNLNPTQTYIITEGLTALNAAEWHKTLQEQQFGLIDISFTWALYTGGKIKAANNAAQARLEGAKHKKDQLSGEQISKLIQLYYGLQLAMEVQDARKEVVSGINKHLQDANKMAKNGMISEAERLHAEVAHANAVQEYRKSAQDVELLQIALQNMLVSKRKIVPLSALFIKDELPPLSDFIDKLDISNPIIKQLESKMNLAQEGIRKEKSEYFPTVALLGYKDLATYQLTEMVPEWMIGVGVKINLFDGFARGNKIKSAKLVKERVINYKEKAKLDLQTYTTQTYQRLLQAQDQHEASLVSIKFAEEYLRIRTKAFSEGFATSTEVNDAQLNLLKVRTENLKSMYDFDTALALLLELSGESQQFINYIN